MKSKIKEMLTSWRILLLLALVVFSIISINPQFDSAGVAVRSVTPNSSAALGGLQPPQPSVDPVDRERIVSVNGKAINALEDYYALTDNVEVNQTLYLKTAAGSTYALRTKQAYNVIVTNETQTIVEEQEITRNITVNGSVLEVTETVNVTREVPKTVREYAGVEPLGVEVSTVARSNIRKGLDLQGGTRVLLQPEVPLTPLDMDTLIESMTQRLNVYGLSDIVVKPAGDLPPPLGEGNQYILVEIAGASESEIKTLLADQGKFEAKIEGETVFSGGEDITFVCRTADCAGIDPNYGCRQSGGEHNCRFEFTITLSEEAAQTQADATRQLEVVQSQDGAYLSSPLELFLDDTKVDELRIGASLQGQPTTTIAISGVGFGRTVDAAAINTLQNMKELQTILITGSLPVKLSIVKADEVSPILGREFVRNSLFMALIAIIAVAIAVAVRYQRAIIALPIVGTMAAELTILFGLASFINWNIDLAAIAGIIAAIGTGVDDQIVIADEALRGGATSGYSWRERIKRAFAIIMLAYVTVVVAMIFLVFAGAGLLKGFALTTILGVSIGVFITRPAFSKLLEILLK